MSGHQIPTESVGAHGAHPNHRGRTASICPEQSHWRKERLIEARGILADIAHHPDTLVLLACRVVSGCSPDPAERADALGVMRLLSADTSERASATPKGGAA